MVCCSLTYRGAQVLHEGSGVAAYAQQGKTMGIPLLHPWANRLASFEYHIAGKDVVLPQDRNSIPVDEAGLPIHGVLPALMLWEVEQPRASALATRTRWSSSQLLELFPFPHDLTLEATAEGGMPEITTTLRPPDDSHWTRG